MTTPTERTNAVIRTGVFLNKLLYPRMTPRVPAEIREQARSLLRHYPSVIDMRNPGESFDNLPATPARGLPACGAERERGGEGLAPPSTGPSGCSIGVEAANDPER